MKEAQLQVIVEIVSIPPTKDTPKVQIISNIANGNTTSTTLRKYSSVEAVD